MTFDFPPHTHGGLVNGDYAPPPMEARALWEHTCRLLRGTPARSYDPGPAPWHRETPMDWFCVTRRAV